MKFEIEMIEGGVVSAKGFLAGSARGQIKTHGDDVALIISQQPATAAAVFTRNLVKAAPVLVCAEHAQSTHARARENIVVLQASSPVVAFGVPTGVVR